MLVVDTTTAERGQHEATQPLPLQATEPTTLAARQEARTGEKLESGQQETTQPLQATEATTLAARQEAMQPLPLHATEAATLAARQEERLEEKLEEKLEERMRVNCCASFVACTRTNSWTY